MRGIRGAASVPENTSQAILEAARELLLEIVQANNIDSDEIVSIIFTVTPDLNTAFPAEAARNLGWELAPLLCTTEIPVPGSLPKCLRVLMHAYLPCSQSQVRHIYLGDAARLRPDLGVK